MRSKQLPYNVFAFYESVKHLAFNFLHSIIGTLPKSIHYIEFFSNYDSNTVFRILAQPPLRYFGTFRNVVGAEAKWKRGLVLKSHFWVLLKFTLYFLGK